MDSIPPVYSSEEDSIDDSIDIAALDHEIDTDMAWANGKRKPKPRKQRLHRSHKYWQAIVWGLSPATRFGQITRRISTSVFNVVFFPVFSPFRLRKTYDIDGKLTVTKRPILWRICDGILMRILLAPVILGLFFITLVWLTTHPKHVQASRSPQSVDLVYREISLRASDNQRLSAWYIPPITVEDVQFSGSRVVSQKWPAAVVAHGLGSTHDDYLALANKLHNAGFAVLMLDLRGQGASDAAAVTFGIRERYDILAGVKYLRELPVIDGGKICLIGQGIGATAALQAAALDSSIAAVVADGVSPSFDGKVKAIFDRPSFPTRWMSPLYEMTFDMMMRERSSDLNLGRLAGNLTRQVILYLAYDGPDSPPVDQVMSLAEETTAPHQVIVSPASEAGGDALDARVTEFLTQATHWVSPRRQVQDEIQKLRAAQVK